MKPARLKINKRYLINLVLVLTHSLIVIGIFDFDVFIVKMYATQVVDQIGDWNCRD